MPGSAHRVPSSGRAAGFGQDCEMLLDLPFFTDLYSSSKSCFPDLRMFSNLALWVETPKQRKERAGTTRECLCVQSFGARKKGAGICLSKSAR